jgi:hypothetical protein
MRSLPGVVALLSLLALADIFGGLAGRRKLPPILYVEQARGVPGQTDAFRQIPGFGPHGRTAPGGTLMIRDSRGARPFFDGDGGPPETRDPAVSWDGRLVSFSGRTAPDSAWRIWIADASGRNLECVTPAGDGDDFDPAWLPDDRLVFASTRYSRHALTGGVAATNLFTIRKDGTDLARMTLEGNGAEEPAIDPRNGRVVYSRWLFNPYRASDDLSGITLDPEHAVPGEPIDLWQTISITPDGDAMRIAGGFPRLAGGLSLYQPVVLGDGSLAGIVADVASLVPGPGATRLALFPGGFSAPVFLTPAGGRAASPAALPDGRLLLSYSSDGSRGMGLHVVRPDGSGLAPVPGAAGDVRPEVDRLDPVPLVARERPPVAAGPLLDPPPLEGTFGVEALTDPDQTFRFDCLNVFTNAPVDAPFPDAPPIGRGTRIRFYAVVPRPPAAGGDTLVLVREAPLTPGGAVHEHELPADIPMFEQLVDADGRVLRTAHGTAHVPGFNFARLGVGTKCVGCHTGHSALPVPKNYTSATWFNAAPSATVTASSALPGTAGPRGVVDRMARGPVERVAWMAAGARNETVRLSWNVPLVLKEVVLYAPADDREAGTRLRLDSCELVWLRKGLEVGRTRVAGRIDPAGTRIEIVPVTVDQLVVNLLESSGTVRHRPVAALAEVEVVTRFAEE